MDQLFKDREKLLKLLPVIALALMIPLSVVAFNYIRNLASRASPEKEPTKIHITNLNSNSVVISWITATQTKGEVLLSESVDMEGQKSFQDVRDEGPIEARDTHYVTLTGLEANTEYFFQIISDAEKYGDPETGVFKVKTLAAQENPPVPKPIKGIVTNGSNQSSIVYVTLEEDSQRSLPISAVTNKTGAWTADLSAAYKGDGSGIFNTSENTKLNILFEAGALGGASVNANVSAEIPDVTLSSSYPVLDIFTTASNIEDVGENTQGTSEEPVDQTSEPTTTPEPQPEPEPTETPVAEEPEQDTSILGASVKLTPMTDAEIASIDYLTLLKQNGFGVLPTTGSEPTGTSVPQNIQVTNVHDTGFTLTWTTTKESTGSVIYDTSSTGGFVNQAKDDKDQSIVAAADYYTHHVSLSGLTPGTEYFYKITSAGENYDNNNSPYSITLPTDFTPSATKEITGTISYSNSGGSLEDSFVISAITDSDNTGTSGKSSLISTSGSSTGDWTLDLGNVLTSDYSNAYDYQDNDKVEFSAYGTYAKSVTTSNLINVVSTGTNDLEISLLDTSTSVTENRTYLPSSDYSSSVGGGGETLPETAVENENAFVWVIIGLVTYVGGIGLSIFLYHRYKRSVWEGKVMSRWEK